MFSLSLKKKKYSPIGLDLGHDWIKMIQLQSDEGPIEVISAEKANVDTQAASDPESKSSYLTSTIKELLAKGCFKGNDVITSLDNDDLNITSIRVSEIDEEQVTESLRKELSHRFNLNPDSDIYDYIYAGEIKHDDDIKKELILFGVSEQKVREHISILEQAGLRPVGIDSIPAALLRSCMAKLRREEDRNRTVVIIDIGAEYTTVVFGRGIEISFIKQIPIGGNSFTKIISDKLDVSISEAQILRKKFNNGTALDNNADLSREMDSSTRQVIVDSIRAGAEELAKKISICFRYYTVTFRGNRLEQAILSGGESYEKILVNTLRRHLAVNIEIAQPLSGYDILNADFAGDKEAALVNGP